MSGRLFSRKPSHMARPNRAAGSRGTTSSRCRLGLHGIDVGLCNTLGGRVAQAQGRRAALRGRCAVLCAAAPRCRARPFLGSSGAALDSHILVSGMPLDASRAFTRPRPPRGFWEGLELAALAYLAGLPA